MGDCLLTGMVVWASSSGVLTEHDYLNMMLLVEASVTHPPGFKPHQVHSNEGSFSLTHFSGVPDESINILAPDQASVTPSGASTSC